MIMPNFQLYQIVGLGAVLIGLYLILFNYVINDDTDYFTPGPKFHIGCYDSNHQLNYSTVVEQKIDLIKLQHKNNSILYMHNSVALRQTFDNNVVDVARAFQKYLEEYYRQKIKNQNDLHFYNTLDSTKSALNKCTKQINLNEQECTNSWGKYINSTKQFKDLKQQLHQKIRNKQMRQRQVTAYISNYQNDDDEEIEVQYDKKIAFEAQKQKDAIDLVSETDSKKNKINKKLKSLNIQISQLQQLLTDCQTNAKYILYCEGINDDLVKWNIDYTSLLQKLALKRKIIDAQFNALRKAKRFGTQAQKIEAQKAYNQSLTEQDFLNNQIKHYQTIQISKCSQCSKDRIRQLNQNITINNRQIQILIEDKKQVSLQLQKQNDNLANIVKQKQRLQNEYYRIKQIGSCNTENCEQQHAQFIKEHQQKLNEIKKEIIELKLEFNSLKQINQQDIKSMYKYIGQINDVENCLRKKDLYEKIRKQAPANDQSQMQQLMSKKTITLIKQLQDFQL